MATLATDKGQMTDKAQHSAAITNGVSKPDSTWA
jgi:hypothetical protein